MSVAGDWIVKYGGSLTNTLDDVTEIFVRCGRTNITDQWNTSTMRIVARYPNGGATPALGNRIGIYAPSDPNATIFVAYVRNVSKIYGMPYDSTTGTAVADYLIIDAEAYLSRWSREVGAFSFTTTKTNVKEAIEEVGDHYDLPYDVDAALASVPCTTTTIPPGSPFGWLQDIIATAQIRVIDNWLSGNTVHFRRPDAFVAASQTPSDQTPTSTKITFDDITAQSLTDNFYNGVEVTADGVGEANAGATGGTNVQIYNVSTRAATVAQAQQIADYLYGQLNRTAITVSSISGKSNGQIATDPWIDLGGGGNLSTIITRRVAIEFRGETVDAVVEGFELTVEPSGWRMSLHLSGGEYYSALVLDSATQGILDTNTLGLY